MRGVSASVPDLFDQKRAMRAAPGVIASREKSGCARKCTACRACARRQATARGPQAELPDQTVERQHVRLLLGADR